MLMIHGLLVPCPHFSEYSGPVQYRVDVPAQRDGFETGRAEAKGHRLFCLVLGLRTTTQDNQDTAKLIGSVQRLVAAVKHSVWATGYSPPVVSYCSLDCWEGCLFSLYSNCPAGMTASDRPRPKQGFLPRYSITKNAQSDMPSAFSSALTPTLESIP